MVSSSREAHRKLLSRSATTLCRQLKNEKGNDSIFNRVGLLMTR